jgi:hypothetical protein
MKTIINATYCFILICCLFSCSKNEKVNPVEIIEIDIQNEIDVTKSLTTNYFKKRKIVKLETTAESIISQINRLILFEGKYYIFDMNSKSVFTFNESGKFISRIKRVGKGPGEYLQISDFTIDTKNKQIILLCDIPNCLIYYDLNGNFLKQIKNNEYFRYITSNDNYFHFVNLLIKYGDKYITTQKEELTTKFLPIEKFVQNKDFYSIHPNIIKSSSTYIFKVYDNVVYQITENEVLPKYQFNFGTKNFAENIASENDLQNILKLSMDRSLVCRINDFRECDNYLTFGTWPFSRIYIYNKLEKTCKLFSKFYDPETGLYLSEMIGHDGNGNELIFSVDPSSFANNILEIKNKDEMAENKTYNEFKSIAENVKDTDNPILMIYTLK